MIWHCKSMTEAPNFAAAVDPPIPPGVQLLAGLRRATDQRRSASCL